MGCFGIASTGSVLLGAAAVEVVLVQFWVHGAEETFGHMEVPQSGASLAHCGSATAQGLCHS